MKIRTRFTFLTAVLVAAVVSAVVFLTIRSEREVLEAQSRQRLEGLSEGVARLAQEALDSRDQLMLIDFLMYLQKDHPELAYAGVTSHGHTWDVGTARPELYYVTRSVAPRHPVKYTVAAPAGKPEADLKVSASGVSLNVSGDAAVSVEESKTGTLEIKLGFVSGLLDDEVAKALAPMRRQAAAIAGVFLLIGMAGAFTLSTHLSAPIMALTAAVSEVKGDRLDLGPIAAGQDEIGALVLRFKEMTSRIKELMQAREDILHTLSHELNTPLSGLKGYLELWQSGLPPEGPQRREALQTMLAAVLRMENSLGGALGLFRSDAGAPLQRSLVALDEVFRQACTLFAPVAASKRIEIELPAPSGEKVFADEELLRRIVLNLLSNALKYTPDGGKVAVGAGSTPQETRFWVADSGHGIPAADLPHLFTKFYRPGAGPQARERIPGSGLGLSIAERAARALGGKIVVQSELGKGTVFIVVIPRAEQPKERAS